MFLSANRVGTSPEHALEVVGELDLAPVAGPGTFEIGRVVTRLDGGVDSHLVADAPGEVAVERAGRRVVGRAARLRHDDDVAPLIAARPNRVIASSRIVEIGV